MKLTTSIEVNVDNNHISLSDMTFCVFIEEEGEIKREDITVSVIHEEQGLLEAVMKVLNKPKGFPPIRAMRDVPTKRLLAIWRV